MNTIMKIILRSLPNKNIVCINREKESYDNFGLIKDRYSKGCIRDKLYVKYILNLKTRFES